MSSETFCVGHANGFEHITPWPSDIPKDWDLGVKFQQQESEHFDFDPMTGDRRWHEPVLVLYVSVCHKNRPNELVTLRYGLTRSEFYSGIVAQERDRHELLSRAQARIRRDLSAIEAGKEALALKQVEIT